MKLSYASLVASVFFIGVRLTISVSMSSETVQESLGRAFEMAGEGSSSWSELGLGGDDLNLQVIESSLMSMVKEGTSPSLKPGILAIYNLTNEMLYSILNQTAFQQDRLHSAWNGWVNCSTDAENNEGKNRFEHLMTILTLCQLNHTSYYQCWDNCSQICEVNANRTEELRKLQCNPDPHNCEMQVRATDDNRAVKNQILSLRAHFDRARQTNVSCNDTPVNCTDDCTTTCQEFTSVEELANCSTNVCEFEETGCHVQHDACRQYNDCYDTAKDEYEAVEYEVHSLDNGSQAEYRAVLRIQCLLNAFLDSIDHPDGTGLDQGINYCINRTYYQYFCRCNACPLSDLQDAEWNPWLGTNATHLGRVCSNTYERFALSTGCGHCAQPYIPQFITYPDVSTNPRKNCTSALFPGLDPPFDLVPGTEAWKNQYYSHWPQNQGLPSCTLNADVCNVNASWNGINAPNLTSHRRDFASSNPLVR